jgi:hypothetical protein
MIRNGGFDASQLESSTRYLQWLQEWVKVSEAWLSNDIRKYSTAASKFYGGEMSCAGMLYAPMIGLLYPEQAESAFATGWDLSLFDIGYAKDITAMVAAITAKAFGGEMPVDSLLNIHFGVDNEELADSRLIGRIVNSIYENVLLEHNAILKKEKINLSLPKLQRKKIDQKTLALMPKYFQSDTAKYLRMLTMFEGMDEKLQDIAFHANEIYMITLSSLFFAQGDFMDAMVFVTNYGRDNDTAGAVVGAIMGAQQGYSGLPSQLREKVLAVNKKELNIDLEALAKGLVAKYASLVKPSLEN